jgi:hypothetical protein
MVVSCDFVANFGESLFCMVQFLLAAGVVPSEEELQTREWVVSEFEKVRMVPIFGLNFLYVQLHVEM